MSRSKMTTKSSEELLSEISMKLDKIIGMLSVAATKEPRDKIKILKNLGITIEETAIITGLTIDVVKKERAKLKK